MNGINTLSFAESIAIRYLRAIATLLIVACHFLQTMGNRWAYILNVGVQLFFVISGYLYGYKQISDWGGQFLNRWMKLYIPYIIFVGILICALKLLHVQDVHFEDEINLTFLSQGFIISNVKGLGHLWFITAIFLCYWITPLLQWLCSKDKSVVTVLLLGGGILSFILLAKTGFGLAWYFSWVFNYSIGYFLARNPLKYRYIYFALCVVFVMLILLNISWSDIISNKNSNIALHAFLAHVIFLVFIFCTGLFGYGKIIEPFRLVEKYSLYIYFVHYPFTRTPWSVVGYSNCMIWDALILVAVIVVFTTIVYTISKYVGKVVEIILIKDKV